MFIKGRRLSKENYVMREYGSSGEDVSVNAVINPKNWGAIPFFGASPLRRYCPPILWIDDRIHHC